MSPGDVVGGRFEILELASAGGMARVYRARDREGGRTVAVKMLRADMVGEQLRFEIEARALAELEHPGIVRYIGHGTSGDDRCYLAMEWLEGEDLSRRLARGRLEVAQSVAVVRRVADALAVAHGRGIVHRDVKPANIFLCGGRIDAVKVIDFGVARTDVVLTRPGVTVGTPGYMAPEQARGERRIDASADVFALGCVLFQCLTGRRAFDGNDARAVLAKLLLDDPPRIRALVPRVPQVLDDLVEAMLRKDAGSRPRDGAAVAALLEQLGDLGASQTTSAGPSSIGTREQRLISAVLAWPRGADALVQSSDEPPTVPLAGALRPAVAGGGVGALRASVARHRGTLDLLADRSILVTVASAGTAGDQAVAAARCALALRAALPAAPIAIATGRERLADAGTGPSAVGDVIDRAAALLRTAEKSCEAGAQPAILVDLVAAGLIGGRFDLRQDGDRALLVGERSGEEPIRTLLGRPSPFVGRDRELAVLLDLFEQCAERKVSRAALVTAPAGMGKSRLRYEMVRRVRDRAEVWLGRGDPIGAGSPFRVIAQAVRDALGLDDGTSASRPEQIQGSVGQCLPGSDGDRAAGFLGELVGVPFPDRSSRWLDAARRDSSLMNDQVRRAFLDFVAARSRSRPLVIVLEDLHWGDRPSVSLVTAALTDLGDRPLMVLGLGRPEVREVFPALWQGCSVTTIDLPELGRGPAEALVRATLGSPVDETVLRIVERAGGNAFFLEELIRGAAEGPREALPETVLAMMQARLGRMEPEARRALRAAAVFGLVFWPGAVSALVSGGGEPADVASWLEELRRREVVTRRPTTRFEGEEEHVFRHALVREAAYSVLTDEDRALGHRLAAAWLERAGERDAATLARHWELGGDRDRAVSSYERAAEQALGGADMAAVHEIAERGIACGATGERWARLVLFEAQVERWRGDFAAVERLARAAQAGVDRGSRLWYETLGHLAFANRSRGDRRVLHELAGDLCSEAPGEGAVKTYVDAANRIVILALQLGDPALAEAVLARAEEAVARLAAEEVDLAGPIQLSRAYVALFTGDLWTFLANYRLVAESAERAGDLRHLCQARSAVGYGLLQLGDAREAASVLREALASARALGLKSFVADVLHNLGLALCRLGTFDEALAVENEAIREFGDLSDSRMVALSRGYLAEILLGAGDADRAEKEAREALDQLAAGSPHRPQALGTLARTLLALRRGPEALAAAREAKERLDANPSVDEGDAEVRMVLAEALAATGQQEDARTAIAEGRSRLMERAARIPDERLRRRFLADVPAHARTLELAGELLER